MPCSDGRSSPSSPATVAAASLMCAAAAASGSARFFNPVISSSNLSTVRSNSFSCLTVVASTVFRLLITSPIALSRSASAAVSAAVWSRMSVMVAPCPWNTVMMDWAMLLTLFGSKAWNSGRNPPISASRSNAG
ncbi:hypothetical protein D522_23360 [Mycobacterium avium subsp. paratuberculosis S5]|nr:hypothetical protein D522_23360 [Mycobacterium avium subsp. paratuberculosis S5]